jgi:multicomponent Na+:H+ antiporter subunit B
MAGTIYMIVRLHGLFAVVMLGGIYSLMAASMFVVLDAVDVAFTEAAVGAGISTVLMLGALALVKSEEKVASRQVLLPLLTALIAGAALIYGTLDMPHYGDPNAPIHLHVAPVYLADSEVKTMGPNVVTSVLASYRGYDTLGETTVILTAGVGVMLILGGNRRRRRKTGKGGE